MSEVTFQSLQEVFEQTFQSEQKLPVSVTISDADYEAFFESIFPQEKPSAFGVKILGEQYYTRQEQQRTANKEQGISHIACYTSGTVIPFYRSRELPSGKVWYEWTPIYKRLYESRVEL